MKIKVNSLSELNEAATNILHFADKIRIITFNGHLGTGKTTLIKAICVLLGIDEGELSSPTYSLINEYQSSTGLKVYHCDFYRIQSEEEARNTGIEDYLNSRSYCFIEWPEQINSLLLYYAHLSLTINHHIPSHSRSIFISKNPLD